MYDEKPHDQWSKRDRIQYLLDHWSDIFDPGVVSASIGDPGDGSGVSLMPKMSHSPSVVELTGCLGTLAGENPLAYRHVKAFRCNAEWRQVKARIKFRGPNGRLLEGIGWKRERIVPSWVNARYVELAEAWLESAFDGEVFIPKELWDGLTAPLPTA